MRKLVVMYVSLIVLVGCYPEIEWSDANVEVDVSVLDKEEVELTISNLPKVANVGFKLSDELSEMVTVSPNEIAEPVPNTEYSIKLVIFPESDSQVGTQVGELQLLVLKDENKTIALTPPLKIVINVEDPALVDLPPEPDPDDNNATLEGIDSDNDGVRDDVQRYIAIAHADNEAIKLSVMKYAEVQQRMLIDSYSEEKSIQNFIDFQKSFMCMFYVTNDFESSSKRASKVKSMMNNTRERTQAYFRAEEQLAGKSLPSVTSEDMSTSCAFDVNNVEGAALRRR
ncbi:hypothetical protein F0231_05355 [Vibrio sp. RE86]|uniref:hypothetical protein n=1 Tax=Vibrio sp. RE86 TaxID=2607605 RepID=UPI0014939176|nr:hypothetical protein [Vibrio sp. RE86]NOH79165.1 hypothetical protein [Vibrio sp. RE86]